MVIKGKAIFQKQKEKDATYAKKIEKKETKINWHDTAENIIAKINAFNPKPGAWFLFKNERIKIIKAQEVGKTGREAEILDDKFTVGCSVNAIQILRLQKEGKREMDVTEFLVGNNLEKRHKIKLKYNYQIIIEYDGTNYSGWQFQKMDLLYKKK